MEEIRSVNPLMDFARKVECSVKLPSNGNWYDNESITFNAINEIDILPMLPNDEMLILNPETLISGDSIIKLIQSCCPGIKNPEELYYPDVNALLLGIKKASSGDELVQQYVCPKCYEKKTKIENDEMLKVIKERYGENHELSTDEAEKLHAEVEEKCRGKIGEMERNNELIITPREYKVSISSLLDSMKLLPKESIYETKNGLKIYVTPYRCKDKIIFATKQIKLNQINKYYEKERKSFEELNGITKEYIDKLENLTNMYKEMTSLTLDIVSSSIKYIELPNGDIVTDKKYIKEFIENSNVEVVNEVMIKIDELNKCGVTQELDLECPCCGHQWKEKFYGFNQADFFGISS